MTGTITGPASITPASGFFSPIEALIIGSLEGILCQKALIIVRTKLNIDDIIDFFAVHGVGGIFRTIIVAAFSLATWQSQLGARGIVAIFTCIVSFVFVKLVGLLTGLRVNIEIEINGLDLSVHGERIYYMNS